MRYQEEYNRLKELENFTDEQIKIGDNLVMKNYVFESASRFLLPGGEFNDDYEYQPIYSEGYEPDVIQEILNKQDAEIEENIRFVYHIIMPEHQTKAKEIIFFFHGFNEKTWTKYLPWAKYIAAHTGKALVLFPIAFHMNRAPLIWSEKREMHRVSLQRQQRHPNVMCSSLSNVASSIRLHNKPQRFIWSGLQTYYDVIQLVETFKQGLHPAIEPDASIDFFSYSIGSFLGEILMMSNKDGYFSDSKYVTICGGAVFNRITPVSKFILDSETDVCLFSFLVEHLDSHMKHIKALGDYLGETHPEGYNFRSMLNYRVMTDYREAKFREMSQRIYAIGLVKDRVIPPYEIMNTLQGRERNIPIQVDVLDFPYTYSHENPFPLLTGIAEAVDEHFKLTFDRICAFLK
ncbi:MAG: DUF6051 family protein [Tannerellaceae bacterium]|jgi:hypothetical protein|nr:DUF6051 family protein [Tannerellaceae bacterium]